MNADGRGCLGQFKVIHASLERIESAHRRIDSIRFNPIAKYANLFVKPEDSHCRNTEHTKVLVECYVSAFKWSNVVKS